MHSAGQLVSIRTEVLAGEQFVHDRLCEVFDVLVGQLHLVPQTACCGVVARGTASQRVFTDLSIGHAHREIGIRVIGLVLFHAELGCAEQLFLLTDAVGYSGKVSTKGGTQIRQTQSIDNAQVVVVLFLIDEDLLAVFHQ